MENIFLSAIKSVIQGVGLKDPNKYLLSLREENELSKIESFLLEFKKETGLKIPEVAIIKLDDNVDDFIKQNFEEDMGDKFYYSCFNGRAIFGKDVLNFENYLLQLFQLIWQHNHYLLVSMLDFAIISSVISTLFSIIFIISGFNTYFIISLIYFFTEIVLYFIVKQIINRFSLKFAINLCSNKKILEIISSVNNK